MIVCSYPCCCWSLFLYIQADIDLYLEDYFSLAGSDATFSGEDEIILTTLEYGIDLNDYIVSGRWNIE